MCGTGGTDRLALMTRQRLDYRSAGVDDVGEKSALSALSATVRKTFGFAGGPGEPGAVHLDLGYFANVIEVGNGMGIAVSTDGVGTKLLVAEMLGKYDTIGIDCVAMNVNDVLCLGARPLTLLDYIAVERADPEMLTAVAAGLLKGAELAGISISGGELAQVAEMVRGVRPGTGFDIVGTAIGLVPLDSMIVGADVVDGDVLLGLASTGIHSNGFSLARKALFESAGYAPDQHHDELGRAVGEELLEPTRIYVKPILSLLAAVEGVKALVHITGDGLLNLLRVQSEVGFELTDLPEPPPVFGLIQRCGAVEDSEMFRVFNMGIGYIVVVDDTSADPALATLRGAGAPDAKIIGRVREDEAGKVILPELGLEGSRGVGFIRSG